jgi:hypothetical protein
MQHTRLGGTLFYVHRRKMSDGAEEASGGKERACAMMENKTTYI